MTNLTFKRALGSDGKYHDLSINIAESVDVQAPSVEPVPAPAVSSGYQIPLRWDAPQFAKNVSSNHIRMTRNSVIENKSFEVHGEPAAVLMAPGSTLRNCRIGGNVREGVRIVEGEYLITDSYLSARGIGEDHADTIQAYAGDDGGEVSLTVRNTLIRAFEEAATAGVFSADNMYGEFIFDGVVFRGGPFGLALNADQKITKVSLRNVFFVGPFGWGRPYQFRNVGGKVEIGAWENVRNATISPEGQLLLGTEIKRP